MSEETLYIDPWTETTGQPHKSTKIKSKTVDLDYLSPEEIDRRVTYGRRKDLYLGEHQRVYFAGKGPRYHYLVVNWLGDVIPSSWSRLLFANFPEIAAPADAGDGAADAVSELVADLELSTLCRTSALQTSWAGETVWKLTFSKHQQRVVVRQVDPVRVTWESDPDDPAVPIAANYWFRRHASLDGKKFDVLVRERQELVPRNNIIITLNKVANALRLRRDERVREFDLRFTYSAYIVKSDESKQAQEIDMKYVRKSSDDLADFTLPIDALTLIYIPNKQSLGDWRGESDFTNSMVSIQGEVNDRASLNKHILDAHSKPTLIIPDDLIVDGQVRVEDLDWLTAKEDGSGRVMYVEWSGEMSASFEQLKWLWEQFNALAGLSTTLSVASNALTGRAKELELVAPIAEVRARRPGWEDAIQQTIYVAMSLERAFDLSKINPVRHVRVVWPMVLPDSRVETAQVTQLLTSCQAISTETSVRLNNPTWSDAEVLAEINRIKADRAEEAERQTATVRAQAEAQMELAARQQELRDRSRVATT